MDAAAFLKYIKALPAYKSQIAHVQHIPSRQAEFAELDRPLHPRLQGHLDSCYLSSLYKHQAVAVNAARQYKNVMVATHSASGKTLCYNLPILETILNERWSRALYLFPTKALAQDQLRSLREFACPDLIEPEDCGTFDGDTSRAERSEIRRRVKLVMTNPDMLHLGILPNHQAWTRLLRHVKYVVIDEAHIYRGVLGSHVANVLRRLRRLCAFYGSEPTFICCSATIANPKEHAEKLVGLPFEIIAEDGSPHGEKDFVFWNPPIVDEIGFARRSANTDASFLLATLVREGIRSLAFAGTRRLTELIYLYSREQLGSPLAQRIKPYRAGYLPQDRRQIEQELFSGELLAVVATTALELGINIGDLEATVLTGYPGSIASTWQQAGRSGRGRGSSLSFLIGRDNPLDQYFMRNPESLFERSCENALINPDNPYVLKPHLLCAAWEMPLSNGDKEVFGSAFTPLVTELEEEGMLIRRSGSPLPNISRKQGRTLAKTSLELPRATWKSPLSTAPLEGAAAEGSLPQPGDNGGEAIEQPQKWYLSTAIDYPAQHINIRSTSERNYAIFDVSQGYELLGTVEASTAFFQIHPGAVYLHQGDSYLITQLDLQAGTALAVRIDLAYYTQAREITDLRVLKVKRERTCRGAGVYLGEVDVTTQVLGFKKKMQFTEEVIGEEYLDLPSHQFLTQALWFDLPPGAEAKLVREGLDFAGGLHAIEHAVIALLPLFALCDRNDIGGLSSPSHPDTGRAQIFIYDAHHGGVGIAEKGFELIEELWQTTLGAILECPCQEGCPSCIQSPKCGNNNEPLDKKAAQLLLQELLPPRDQSKGTN